MRPRRLARRLALQYLFMADLVGADKAQPLEEFLVEHADPEHEEARAFAAQIIRGVLATIGEIDARISSAADNWELGRIAAVERNVLRIGCAEFLDRTAPPKVVLDEAVELAKAFGSKESGGFVNGVLDKIRKANFVEENGADKVEEAGEEKDEDPES
jgi:transcription antitermination protein NusB